MEKYCITSQQAKKIASLTSKLPESQYVWHESPFHEDMLLGLSAEWLGYPAYNVGELGGILPAWSYNILGRLNPDLEDSGNSWFLSYPDQSECRGIQAEFTTEAQARGHLLIYLLENKLL